MKSHNIIETNLSPKVPYTKIREAFTDYDKAVITCAMYNRDAAENQYFSITSVELDDSDNLTANREGAAIFITDNNMNSVEVVFNIDKDGQPDNAKIEGSSVSDLELSEELTRQIDNALEDVQDYIKEERIDADFHSDI